MRNRSLKLRRYAAARLPRTRRSEAMVPRRAYSTDLGTMWISKIEDALDRQPLVAAKGKVNLLFTSPPFPLVFKKKYGNKSGEEYLDWLRGLAPRLTDLLAPDGSIVIEIGNAWESGSPTMSTLPLRALLAFQEAGDLNLCQHVVCHNPARLPSPAQWVTVERIRLKDSFTHVWWLSKTSRPRANNREVQTPYSDDMKKLLKTKKFNAGPRPSGHVVSQTGFLKNNRGAISASVVDIDDPSKLPTSLLKISNTAWDTRYVDYCRERRIEPHPARMRAELALFFIRFLTKKHDLVVDPFGGSNTTGAAAEALQRRWITIEAEAAYAEGSLGRFPGARRGGRK
jgi:DNA modification methylase